jgi:maltooligosyltrehalose trehalohydrolase
MESFAAARRRFPIGAELQGEAGVSFRLWAPERRRVRITLERAGGGGDRTVRDLRSEADGYYSAVIAEAEAGTLYQFLLDDDPNLYPDPASRYQPDGPHGPSEVVDPFSFSWSDGAWRGLKSEGHVIYEMHVGTLTREGTFEAALPLLPDLASHGVTIIELMPVAEFPGRFGWGYDGVDLFAPTRLYGRPDDLRRFVDEAHGLGIGVILDVVYNHFGPDGCYLRECSPHYFTDRYENEWGDPINFDGPQSEPVRAFFLANARYWIEEFHLDGLRLDATQSIFDASPTHILGEIVAAVRAAAPERGTYVVAEHEPQHAKLVRPKERGGYGIDGLWNDDFHHSAAVALTGRNEAYYSDYLGRPQEFVSMARHGFLYQGQHYRWQKKRRGMPSLDLDPCVLVAYLQNHDQVANSADGARLHELTSPGMLRAATALLLLGPAPPMLFQGQEFGASSPFLYFADHEPELARAVASGRRKFLAQFPSIATAEMQVRIPDPSDRQTFVRCKLDWSERERNAPLYRLHRDLIRLRREDPVLSRCGVGRRVEGAVLGPEAFLLRYLDEQQGRDRLLLVNFGCDLRLDPAPEPLLAPPAGLHWSVLWSSEEPDYGGGGTVPAERVDHWLLPGHAALLLAATEPPEAATHNGTAEQPSD